MENYQKELYKEKAIRGESLFPIGFYRITDLQSTQILPYHWHKEFEIIYMTKGSALFQIDDECYELKKGQAIFINGGRLHSGLSINEHPCSYDAIVFELEDLVDFSDRCIEYLKDIKMNKVIIKSCYLGESLWEKELLYHLNEICTGLYKREYGFHLAVKGRLLLLFSLVLTNGAYSINEKGTIPLTESVERMKIVVQYIQEHYQSKITIDDLAARLNMNRHYFCRFFKKVTGITAVDYINSYRTERAAALIETSNISIMEAGLEVGFDNFSYFIKIFKRIKNCTPSEYRKLQIEKHKEREVSE